ncbi:MAG: YopT-type cysteine protease domain-containing protein [Acidobacteria bacterium]|nr:YopT-type cysteine protease domain-containing protein [Acidobacteriota bacterium]
MSQSKPRFHKQETSYSCVPACLRMVLSGFGLDLTEGRLRELCDCSPIFGTDAMRAVEAARGRGFVRTAKYTLQYDELRSLVADGRHPIAYLSLEAIGGTEESHAVVVIEADDQTITVYDPLYGERRISRQSFAAAWAARRNLAILVEN